ncbi:MAG TPA: flagellar basal body rod protein, partial [Clostridiales bacterium]|nr:flagellar basal body rod protein [Clostridiales bacterium]
KMIEASKAFSFNSRMVQVADEVEQTINNLR